MQTVWLGPISVAQVGAAVAPGSRLGVLNCLGDRAPTCATQADAWSPRLAGMLSAAKLGPADRDGVVMGCFSAGGSSGKRVLVDPAARASIRAVMLSDATYTSWASPGKPLPPEGFVLFALDAIGGDKLLVATASSFANKDLPTGSQTLQALKEEVERRAGVHFEEGGTLPGVPVPTRLWTLPNVILADYALTVPHTSHPKLAPALWANILAPHLQGLPEKQAPPTELTADTSAILPALIGAAVGFAAVRMIRT